MAEITQDMTLGQALDLAQSRATEANEKNAAKNIGQFRNAITKGKLGENVNLESPYFTTVKSKDYLTNIQAGKGKVETDFSVAQLAYFCRVMYDLKYFQNKNQTDMLKVAANNFTTSNAQEISIKSLKAKYYSVDNSTRESIKKRLIEMLNYVNKKM